ncbi:MAG TPA: hypothetical protein VM051_09370 [Usitatibacter sp.]|nr:hypothetical protein [Usitatibacter sp.]
MAVTDRTLLFSLSRREDVRHSGLLPLEELRPALEALARARLRCPTPRSHRGLVHLEVAPYLVQVLALPAMFIGLLVYLEPRLVAFWQEFVMACAGVLDIPVRTIGGTGEWGELRLLWVDFESRALLPTSRDILVGLGVAVLAFAGSFAIPTRLLPLRYIARVGAALLALSSLFFLVGDFPYAITDHVRSLSEGGFVLMATIPAMLAIGYYVLRIPIGVKIFHTALVMGYFAVLVPLEIVLHMLLLQHFTLLLMPILYLVFGSVLNFVVFIALYSWMASTVPEDGAGGAAAAG